jgi:hypothetical protein
MCILLQIKRINSTSFNPKIQGEVEKFRAVLNQTTSHVNKYGNWDNFDYALKVHRSTPHTTTTFRHLLHDREMRLPTTDRLYARVNTDPISGNPVGDHTRVLAERLREAYEVVKEHNKLGRQQKIQYDKNNSLVKFAD